MAMVLSPAELVDFGKLSDLAALTQAGHSRSE
jgi:hypothetical protein